MFPYQNLKFNKDSLKSSIPEQDILKDLMIAYQNYLVGTQDLINATNSKFLEYLDNIGSFNGQAIKDLRAMYGLVGDLYVLNGKTSTSSSLLDLNIFSNQSVISNPSSNEIKLDQDSAFTNDFIKSNIQIANVRIQPKVGDQLNRDIFFGTYKDIQNSQIENILSDKYKLGIYSVDKPLGFSIIIDLGDARPVNNVSFSINNSAIPFVNIKALEVAVNNTFAPLRILNSNALTASGYDIIKSTGALSSILNIEFDNQITRYIKLDIAFNDFILNDNKRIYSIGINNLKSGFFVPVESGSIIYGPVTFTDEVFKASIDCVLEEYNPEDPNILFEIGHTKTGPFQALVNSIDLNTGTLKNIVNYNNVDKESINTVSPVKELYLRVSLKSVTKQIADILKININDIEAYIDRVRITITKDNTTANIPSVKNPENLEVFKELKSFSGKTITSASRVKTKNISEYRSDEKYICNSVGTGFDVSREYFAITNNESNIFTYKPERLFMVTTEKTTCYPVYDYDKYAIDIYGLSAPLSHSSKGTAQLIRDRYYLKPSSGINILPINKPFGNYKVLFNNGDYFILDLNCGFAESVSEFNFKIEKEDITSYKLFNEIGREIGSGTVLGSTIKYISLFDQFIESVPVATGFTFNKFFPVIDNTESEFSLTRDGIVFNKPFTGQVNNLYKVVKTNISKEYIGRSLIIDNPKTISFTTDLIDADYQRIYQLPRNNIINGSIKFKSDKASLNPFVNEVPYINGRDEFVVTQLYSQINNTGLNIIELRNDFVGDETAYITFEGETDLFKNQVYSIEELINVGDWLIKYDGDLNKWTILLHPDAKTSSVFDTIITYEIKGNKNNFGLYSVDYVNGILYSAGAMDSRINISFQYSSTFAAYEHLEKINPNKYTVKDGSINIKNETGNASDTYITVYNRINEITDNAEILVTPKVKDLTINVLIKKEIL